MVKKFFVLFSIFIVIIISIAIYTYIKTTQPDPELNIELYCDMRHNKKYLDFYSSLFKKLNFEINFSMALDWVVISYEDIYTNKEDIFYNGAFDSRQKSGEKNVKDLLDLYDTDNEKYYYLKPFLDCYLLMNKDHKPTEKELETIKKTILYALDYYINGKDFVGTLE